MLKQTEIYSAGKPADYSFGSIYEWTVSDAKLRKKYKSISPLTVYCTLGGMVPEDARKSIKQASEYFSRDELYFITDLMPMRNWNNIPEDTPPKTNKVRVLAAGLLRENWLLDC